MKLLASLALAGALAFGATTGTTEKAEAGDAGAAIAGFALGAIVGSHLGNHHGYHGGPNVYFHYGPRPRPRYFGGYYAPQPYYYKPQPRYYGGGGWDAHVQWCLNHYRTYNPYTNLYFYKQGKQRYCNSPFS